MSEYEILDLMASMEAHMATQFSLYLTVISAYMIVAYLAGEKLTTAQVWIASALMLFAAGGQAWALYASTGRVLEYLHLKEQQSPLTQYEQNFAANGYVWVFILTCGVLAALYFMWGVRRDRHAAT
jgi:hypothetical protein